jgi:hypothetical protein
VISACPLSALSGIAVKMIFHGASDMNLSFVVDEKQADAAVRSMHRVMFPAQTTQSRVMASHVRSEDAVTVAGA